MSRFVSLDKRKAIVMNPDLGSSDATEAIREWLKWFDVQSPFPSLDLATLHYLKAREVPPYQVQYVAVQDSSGHNWRSTFLLEQLEGRWFVKMHSAGYESSYEEPSELQNRPWVRLETLFLGQEFYAVGEVFEKEVALAGVRLFDAADFLLEDTVQQGLVFFYAQRQPTTPPLRLELYDEQGILISRQTETLDLFPSVEEENS